MEKENQPEVWLRGPVENIPALLQPVAHALLQAKEEVIKNMAGFPDDYLWLKPAGVASVGFHLQHLAGVLDRLFTYAKGKMLNEKQLSELEHEGRSIPGRSTVNELMQLFNEQVDKAIQHLRTVDKQTLTEQRLVGRDQRPSTLIGLLVHTAEHTMRHVGQLYVTMNVVKDRLKTGL